MIEQMTIDDLQDVCQLEEILFTSSWKMNDFLYELNDNPYSCYFVYKLNNKVIGYIGEWITFEQAQITTLGVDPEYQGQGIATSLLEHAILIANQKQCEIMSLEVRVSNIVALNLYKKLGFEIVNIRKGYYQDNHEDAYLMIKPLGDLL